MWRLDHGPGKPGCNFVEAGKVGVPLARGEDPGAPHPSGLVARGRFDGDDSVVYVVKPGEQVPTELARSPSIRFDPPAWIAAVQLEPDEHQPLDAVLTQQTLCARPG